MLTVPAEAIIYNGPGAPVIWQEQLPVRIHINKAGNKMIRISQLKLSIKHTEEDIISAIANTLKLP
jgi:hypothetical protein